MKVDDFQEFIPLDAVCKKGKALKALMLLVEFLIFALLTDQCLDPIIVF
jgi:hypothetical protein